MLNICKKLVCKQTINSDIQPDRISDWIPNIKRPFIHPYNKNAAPVDEGDGHGNDGEDGEGQRHHAHHEPARAQVHAAAAVTDQPTQSSTRSSS